MQIYVYDKSLKMALLGRWVDAVLVLVDIARLFLWGGCTSLYSDHQYVRVPVCLHMFW